MRGPAAVVAGTAVIVTRVVAVAVVLVVVWMEVLVRVAKGCTCTKFSGSVASIHNQGLTLVRFSAERNHFLWTKDVHFSA